MFGVLVSFSQYIGSLKCMPSLSNYLSSLSINVIPEQKLTRSIFICYFGAIKEIKYKISSANRVTIGNETLYVLIKKN